jgi:ABC-type polysaccharide/polyol phosphate export permease
MKTSLQKKKYNFRDLVLILAKNDFKMRYHGSVLGYVWAILKPLFIFLILNFVFSQVIARGAGIENYPLQLITGIIIWNFFQEGTSIGLLSLLNKANIITKVYFPRWIVVFSSTVHSVLVFLMNLLILVGFFVYYQVFPSLGAILMFCFYMLVLYFIILGFSFIASVLYLRFRDLIQIWDVILQGLFYATPIIYPLSLIPDEYHKIILLNPLGIIIHYTKMVLIEHRFPSLGNNLLILIIASSIFLISVYFFNRNKKRIAEDI